MKMTKEIRDWYLVSIIYTFTDINSLEGFLAKPEIATKWDSDDLEFFKSNWETKNSIPELSKPIVDFPAETKATDFFDPFTENKPKPKVDKK